MSNQKQDFERRMCETIDEFYEYGFPSDYLDMLQTLISGYLDPSEDESPDIDMRHINQTVYGATKIGLFIVKLKEDYDRIKALKQKGGEPCV